MRVCIYEYMRIFIPICEYVHISEYMRVCVYVIKSKCKGKIKLERTQLLSDLII